jgi:hypothetical protein
VLETLTQAHELRHCLSLELLNVLMLLFQLTISAVFESAKLQ